MLPELENELYFASIGRSKTHENSLFHIQVDNGNKQFRAPIEFQENILLRHKISNKYLNYSSEFEDEQNDSTVKLQLSSRKCYFKILPCFQYQIKISNKVKFNEDIYLATKFNSSRDGFITAKPQNSDKLKTFIGFNYKSKIMMHSYYEREKEQEGYIFGQAVWLGHIQSNTFLTVIRPNTTKQEIVFDSFDSEETLQNINGLWLIDSIKPQIGGLLHFNEIFRLKNICSGRYLSFSKNYKLVDNERIYSLNFQQNPSEQSNFIFESLKQEDNIIKKGSYLIFKHQQSGEFMGTRKSQRSQQLHTYLPVSTFAVFEDQDLFEMKELASQDEEAVRFVFSIQRQVKIINQKLHGKQQLTLAFLKSIQKLFLNAIQSMQKLSASSSIFEQIQQQLGPLIPHLCEQIIQIQSRVQEESDSLYYLIRIKKILYQIINILCKDYRDNQVIAYNQIHIFAQDMFKNLGSQELLSELFRNNYSLLCKLPNAISKLSGKNLIKQLFLNICNSEAIKTKNQEYWQKITKLLNLLDVLLTYKNSRIDINQRLISTQLFQKGIFNKIFFDIKVMAKKLMFMQPIQKIWTPIQKSTQKQISKIIQKIFDLFSSLCENRNLVSKRYIHDYLNENSQNGVQVIIQYINMSTSQQLSNNLFSLVTNCYVDSSPRINRYKPLAVITFVINKQISSIMSNKLSDEEAVISGRLKDSLLNQAQRSYATRPLNIAKTKAQMEDNNVQPSLTSKQLTMYKQKLSSKIQQNVLSSDLLRAICILMRLQIYSVAEIQQINSMLNQKIIKNKLSKDIIAGAMQIFQQISNYSLQVELKKLTTYLKYKFTDQTLLDLNKQQLPYIMASSPQLSKPIININDLQTLDMKQQHNKNMLYINEYNYYVKILQNLYPNKYLKASIFEMFIAEEQYSYSVLSSIFQTMNKFNQSKISFIKLLIKCIIITSKEVSTFDTLYDLHKKIKHLVSISQHWLCSEKQSPQSSQFSQFTQFMRNANQLTNYFFDGLENVNIRKHAKLNMNHQLTIKNLAIHSIILDLLKKNYYLLQGKAKKQLLKKQKEAFQICFQFLYYFCMKCPQNIASLSQNMQILDRFRQLCEIGQTKLLALLYSQQISLIKQLKPAMIQKMLEKIVGDIKIKGNDMCEYNPLYIDYVLSAITANGKMYKKNIQYIYRILQKQIILKKLLFIEQRGGRFYLCLDMLKFKADPLHVPFIYHKKVIKLFTTLIQNLQSSGNSLKYRLKEYINFDQICHLLTEPDIYTCTGVMADLNFLLKRQLLVLLDLYIDKNDSLSKIYESDQLRMMLDHFIDIFAHQKEKKLIQLQSEYLIMPYLQKYKKKLQFYRKNIKHYYLKQVRPLIVKLFAIFQKILNKQENQIYKRLCYLLGQINSDKLAQEHQKQNKVISLEKINIKWRNFVDEDVVNSVQQKYAKKIVLQILRHNEVYQIVQEENNSNHQLLFQKQNKYVAAMTKLIKMTAEQENMVGQSHSSLNNFCGIIRSLAEYFEWKMKKGKQIKKGWDEQDLIETLINYVNRQVFNFNNELVRKIFYQILRIFNYLLEIDHQCSLRKDFFKLFTSNQSCYRFFNCLRDALIQISERIQGQRSDEQVNIALRQLYLCGQEHKRDIDKESLNFMKLLCKHLPFTEFLRNQPYLFSTDFLDKIYNAFYFMIKRSHSSKLIVTMAIVDISEFILECIMGMMNGCNKANQMFVIDNKFPDLIVQCLKMQVIHDRRDKQELNKRNELLGVVIQFYKSNGIDVASLLEQKIKMIDFKHLYLLNRLKYTLLKVLMQSTLANQISLSKVKIMVPIQLLKINLIWIYEDFIKQKLKYQEQIILKQKQDWLTVLNKDKLSGTFLMIGFYFFILILLCDDQKQTGDDEIEVVTDQEKQKEKIVKNFFSSISDNERNIQKIKGLQKEMFADQMILYYNKYYEAYKFFKKKTITIEASVFNNLVKIYFPSIPLCDKLTAKIQQKLIQNAQRISQDQKIKSLMQFQKETYMILQGETEYQNKMHSKSKFLGKFIELMSDQQDLFLIAWIISCLTIIVYLLDDYDNPIKKFNETIGSYLTPNTIGQGVMLILNISNLMVSMLLLVNLLLKKIPFLSYIYEEKYKQQSKKDEGMFQNLSTFQIKNIVSDSFFDIYVITFAMSSMLHPLFSGFLLVYIIKRISLGKQIVQAIEQTWFSLLIATALLIVFNYIYSIYIYVATYTDDNGYGKTCTFLQRCLMMLVDQSLKSGSGFLGTVTTDYTNNVINIKFLSEITYILFAQKVIFEIFSGTIIDKFSQLRQKSEATKEDQQSNCFICGQQRFQIDFQLQGFEEHVNKTHNKLHYIYYMFYLRKKGKKEYGIEETFIWEEHFKQNHSWIPDGTSLLKETKEEENNQKQIQKTQHKKICQKKIFELKKMKTKIQNLSGQLKEGNSHS